MTGDISGVIYHSDMKIDIKNIRKRLKLTQEQLAQKLGVTWVTINRWENGKFNPSPLAIREIQRLIEEVKRG